MARAARISTRALRWAASIEIKRTGVSWTLAKKLDTFAGPGEIKRRGGGGLLDPQVSPERRSKAGRWSWA